MGEGDEEREKWMNNDYSSLHEILLLGEGDFSFALSLALSFGSATNILATSLDSYESLMKKYKRAKSNLGGLQSMKGLEKILLGYFVGILLMWRIHLGVVRKESATMSMKQ